VKQRTFMPARFYHGGNGRKPLAVISAGASFRVALGKIGIYEEKFNFVVGCDDGRLLLVEFVTLILRI